MPPLWRAERVQIGREEIEVSLSGDEMIAYAENLKASGNLMTGAFENHLSKENEVEG